MAPHDPDPEVIDDRDNGRYLFEQDGLTGELDYEEAPGRLILVHTEVPAELGGRGVAGRLVQAALAKAVAEGLTVVPHCSYARKWLRDHPDPASTVRIDWSG